MKRKQDYRNQLRFDVLLKWTSLLAAIGLAASAYAYLRNLHIHEADYVRQAEREMTALEAETEMYRTRIEGMLERVALEERLGRQGSALRDIGRPTLEIVEVKPKRLGPEADMVAIH